MSEKRDWLKIFSAFTPDAREPINEWLQRLIDYWAKNGESLTFHAMRGGWNRHGRKLFPEISDRDCSAKHNSTVGTKPKEEKTPEQYFQEKKESETFKREKQQYGANEKYLLKKIEQLEKDIQEIAHVCRTPQSYKIYPDKKSPSSSTAIVLASDWHIEEEVEPDTVSGLNKFTLDIADRRIKNFIKNSVKLVHASQNETTINDIILALLGDFITGDIHLDNIESCALRPAEAIWEAQKHIVSCIDYYLENTDCTLTIPCHSGNHARTTHKQMIANERGHSLEYYMYLNLKLHYDKNPRVKFIIAEGYHSYVDINGFIVRFHHGHAIRFMGGIGGLFIPAYKAISQWNKAKVVDLDCFGHHHQDRDGANFVCNPSLIGYSPFSIFIKSDYEIPAQTFLLINHERRRKTMKTTIFLE